MRLWAYKANQRRERIKIPTEFTQIDEDAIMKNPNTNTNPVYTVIQTIGSTMGPFKRVDIFTHESAAMQFAWTCVNLLNARWAEVYAPNGDRIALHVAA